jgi:hypothetical protein
VLPSNPPETGCVRGEDPSWDRVLLLLEEELEALHLIAGAEYINVVDAFQRAVVAVEL